MLPEVISLDAAEVDTDRARDALLPVLRDPLARESDPLADIAPADLLAELEFELPLAGGDHPSPIGVARGSRNCCDATSPPTIHSGRTPTQCRPFEPTPLRGYLTGQYRRRVADPGPRT